MPVDNRKDKLYRKINKHKTNPTLEQLRDTDISELSDRRIKCTRFRRRCKTVFMSKCYYIAYCVMTGLDFNYVKFEFM